MVVILQPFASSRAHSGETMRVECYFDFHTNTVSTKPLVLYTVPTPNGVPISIFLEDLKAIHSNVNYEWVACKAPHKPWLTTVVSVEKISFQKKTHMVHIILCGVTFAMLNLCFYRNHGSPRWTQTLESPSSPIVPVEIFAYSSRLPFCFILRNTTTRVTYIGLMLRRTPTITTKCFNGFSSLYVLVQEVRERFR